MSRDLPVAPCPNHVFSLTSNVTPTAYGWCFSGRLYILPRGCTRQTKCQHPNRWSHQGILDEGKARRVKNIAGATQRRAALSMRKSAPDSFHALWQRICPMLPVALQPIEATVGLKFTTVSKFVPKPTKPTNVDPPSSSLWTHQTVLPWRQGSWSVHINLNAMQLESNGPQAKLFFSEV